MRKFDGLEGRQVDEVQWAKGANLHEEGLERLDARIVQDDLENTSDACFETACSDKP